MSNRELTRTGCLVNLFNGETQNRVDLEVALQVGWFWGVEGTHTHIHIHTDAHTLL